MENLNDYVAIHKPKIYSEIVNFLNQKINEDETQIVFYKDFLGRLSKFTKNGKMLRGLLVILGYEMQNKKVTTQVYKTAAAIEIIHAALLIHDDIIDKDEVRRGEKSIPAQYKDGRDDFYGEAMAVCAADIAFFLAIELLSKNSNSETVARLSQEIQRVAAAEMIDYHFGATSDEPGIDEILNLYKNKSARYTFSLPLSIGAMMGGENDKKIKLLEQFGEKLGTVFQIIDDEIGLLGNEAEIGKPVGSDIKQDKKTLFRVYLYQRASEANKKYLDSVFGNEKIKKSDIERVKKLIFDYKIKEEIDTISHALSNEARDTITRLHLNNKYSTLLSELIDFNLKRAN